ncbi:hypothetical protein HCJ96_12470 [Alteromonas sp. MYP5]|uniref:Response receiver domain-containing protein n=2 Tax=Alteromonas ponticola TaxID=2720613 RepID=A0ABX1R314_9ALTE|nr:hypothetical protein [Alteromonas ponticola]
MDDFSRHSEIIANNFIQSIIFVDDKAYSTDGHRDQHEFDAQSITRVFSENGKICAVYRPIVESDVEVLSEVAKKSDVAVLDWQIILDDVPIEDGDYDDEADDDDDDVRGIYTKRIIRSLVSASECEYSIKLIIVYTGETDLQYIATEINASLKEGDIENFSICDSDPFTIISDSCKIMVVGKSNSANGRAKHNPALRGKIISYDELPSFISKEFSAMTAGLLSNFAMESLTEIRQNFHHIVRKFSRELDAAYLAHQVLLPNTDDANELLVELIGDTFTSLLRYKQLNRTIDKSYIEKWLKDNVTEKSKLLLKNDGSEDKFEYSRTHSVLLKLLGSNPDVVDKFVQAIGNVKNVKADNSEQALSKSNARTLSSKYAITLFTDVEKYEEINKQFANLCYHRHAFIHTSYLPSLSLGTVVKSTSEEGKYYVCIQQRCDSVRLKDFESRRFLFISLSEIDEGGGFNFLTPDGTKLKIDKGTFALRTVKFNGFNGIVIAKYCERTEKKYFEPSHFCDEIPEKFEFIVELKELYAQRIAEEYSAGLSRVGLDEPEWVRLLN